jgi:D-aspartate ligase
MRDVRQVPGVVVLGNDSKALGVIRSLGRRRIPALAIDGQPCSAWLSRHITRCFSWEGSIQKVVALVAQLPHKPPYKEAFA